MRFFTEVFEPRYPRTLLEGIAKGFLLGAMIMAPYDAFSPFPNSLAEMQAHSERILLGYKFFVYLGGFAGLIGEFIFAPEENQAPGLDR